MIPLDMPRADVQLRKALVRAAAVEDRSPTSLVSVIVRSWLEKRGYLPKLRVHPAEAPARSRKLP